MIEDPAEQILHSAMLTLHRRWLRTNRMSQNIYNRIPPPDAPSIPFPSLTGFVSFLFGLPNAPTTVDLGVDQLLGYSLDPSAIRATCPEPAPTNGHFAREALCLGVVERLAWEVIKGGHTSLKKLELGALDMDAAAAIIARPRFRGGIEQDLCAQLLQVAQGVTVRNLYVGRRAHGFWRWRPGCAHGFYGFGKRLTVPDRLTPFGPVHVDLLRCEPDEEAARAYSWCGQLDSAADGSVEAVAWGMVYTFRRDTAGVPLSGSARDLVFAADAQSDDDVLQVGAFLKQHQDFEELVLAGDLCFLTVWERREGSRKGAGRACLAGCIKALNKKFRHLRTLVVHIEPYQFLALDPRFPEPGLITLERLEALDALHEHVVSMRGDLGRPDVRVIVDRDDGDPEAALTILANALDGEL